MNNDGSVKLVCCCEMAGAEELDLRTDCWTVEVALPADLLPESPARHDETHITHSAAQHSSRVVSVSERERE